MIRGHEIVELTPQPRCGFAVRSSETQERRDTIVLCAGVALREMTGGLRGKWYSVCQSEPVQCVKSQHFQRASLTDFFHQNQSQLTTVGFIVVLF